jgi:hypothetical protein
VADHEQTMNVDRTDKVHATVFEGAAPGITQRGLAWRSQTANASCSRSRPMDARAVHRDIVEDVAQLATSQDFRRRSEA